MTICGEEINLMGISGKTERTGDGLKEKENMDGGTCGRLSTEQEGISGE